jgi:hypothetical protein
MVIGIRATLLVAAGWVIVSTLFVIRLRVVREVGVDDETDAQLLPAQ